MDGVLGGSMLLRIDKPVDVVPRCESVGHPVFVLFHPKLQVVRYASVNVARATAQDIDPKGSTDQRHDPLPDTVCVQQVNNRSLVPPKKLEVAVRQKQVPPSSG